MGWGEVGVRMWVWETGEAGGLELKVRDRVSAGGNRG